MALVTQSANLVRQKTNMIVRSPGVFYALKSLFLHLAANKNNPDLFFKNIDGAYSSSDGGNNASQVLVDAPCSLYAIWLKKSGAVATSFKASNHATTAATDGTQALGYVLTTANEENCFLFPDGHILTAGLTVTENTAPTTGTLTLAANKIDGFVIVGA